MVLYKYSPLECDEIRLLKLSSKNSGSVRIKLEKRRLSPSDPPYYEALSYAWGSKDNPCYVAVEDDSNLKNLNDVNQQDSSVRAPSRTLRDTTCLAVTRNLAEALTYLQLEQERRILWIDAICINQEDVKERGSQVRRMADIYKMSQRTIIWLGPTDHNSWLALTALEVLASTVDVDFVTEKVHTRQGKEKLFQEMMSVLYSDEPTRCSLVSLLKKPWFERLWVWQEARANPNHTFILVGMDSIAWTLLRKALTVLYWQTEAPSGSSKPLRQAYALCNRSSILFFLDLLHQTRKSKCADPRDRVFALLGMLGTDERLGIEPNYEKTVGEVYTEVVLCHLDAGRDLEFLQHCQLVDAADIPSWVPVWSRPSASFFSVATYNASLSTPAQAVYDGKGKLTVSGIQVSCISSTTSLEAFQRGTNSTLDEFATALFSLLPASTCQNLVRDNSVMELLIYTLCRGSLADEYSPPRQDLPAMDQVKHVLLHQYQRQCKRRLRSSNTTIERDFFKTYKFRKLVQASTYGSKLIWTESGDFGIGPECSLPGDMLCVVFGCHAPLILRSVSPTESVVVGEFYIRKVMDGSILLPLPLSNFRPIKRLHKEDGRYSAAFLNMKTGSVQVEDPRLQEPLPPGWTVIKHENDQDKLIFHNEEEDMHTWRDPRLLPDALIARGINVVTFNLV